MKLPRWEPFAATGIVAMLALAAVIQSAIARDLTALQLVAALLLPPVVLALWLGRDRPTLVMAAALSCIPLVAAMTKLQSYSAGWFALVVIAAQLALTMAFRPGLIVYLTMLVVVAASGIRSPDDGWISWAIGISAGFWGGWSARARIEAMEVERNAALASERQRLARDLHDVVAHTLAVTVLHLGGARLAVEHEPEHAADAIAEAERARESMAQLRQIVGVLNDDSADLRERPQPTAAELPALVDEYRDAGLPLGASISGDLAGLPATTGVVLYRIAQEALANAARHAPQATVGLDVDISGDDVHLVVRNPTGRRDVGSGGLGVPSMKERAAAVGGNLTAGVIDSAWVVEAWLPARAS